MKAAIVTAGVLAMAIPWAAAQQQAIDPLVSSCVGNPDHDLAIGACTSLLEKGNPTSPQQRSRAHAVRGSRYLAKGDFDRAISDLNEAVRIAPGDAKIRNGRGIALAQKGELDRAKDDFDEAVRIDPGYAIAYANRASLHMTRGEADKAIEDSAASIKRDPTFADPYNTRGLAYAQKGSWHRAIRDLSEAIRFDPGDSKAHKNRGFAYLAKGDLKRSMADFDRAIEIDPKDAGSYANRGQVHLRLEEFDRAISDLDQAILLHEADRLPPRRAVPGGNRVTMEQPLYIDPGKQRPQANPAFADAFRNRGIAWFQKGKFEKAVPDLDEALRLDPGDKEARAWRDKAAKAQSGGK